MPLTNYHTHCTFCDGHESAEDMTLAAIAGGFSVIGFSSHAPLPFSTGWTMEEANLRPYIDEISRLKKKFSGRIEVLLGFEMDWLPGYRVPGDGFWKDIPRDYAIGSVHYVHAPDGNIFTVDDQPETLTQALKGRYRDNAQQLVVDYYAAMRDMIRHGHFDILGHFDLIKKNNIACHFFDGEASWYRDAVMETIEELAAFPAVVEINTGGMARGKITSTYPEVWMLKEMKERGIRVCVCSDAHRSKHLLANQADGVAAAKAAGYAELAYLSKGEWKVDGI